MSLELIYSFIDSKKSSLSKDNDSVEVLSKSAPVDVVTEAPSEKASASALDRFADSPLVQLGEDFIAEQVARNGHQIMNNAIGAVDRTINRITGIPVRKTTEQAQQLVFNSISAAVTAKNEVVMIFLRQVAEQAIAALNQKRAIASELTGKVTELHNALKIMIAGQPFFSPYLAQLRQALALIVEAENKITLVRNTFVSTDTFINSSFDDAKTKLESAEALLAPPDDDPDIKFNGGLLDNVGIPSEPQQLTVLLAVPQLVQDCLLAANGYFVANLKANALILAFQQGLNTLQESGSKKLKEYTISVLDSLLRRIDELVGQIADGVNGSPTATEGPISGFNPSPVKVSFSSLRWVFELRAIIEYTTFVPGQALKDIQISNKAVQAYEDAVEALQTKDNRVLGDAVLIATDGQEDIGQLEQQLTTYTMAALQAIVDGTAADSILALGRTIINRLHLSLTQDNEIIEILQTFVDSDLAIDDTVERLGDNIYSLLDTFGLDRAADLLRSGNFEDFFNLNSKTATFAGAALVGIATIKNCLETEEDREQLTQAEREIQRENKSKELFAQRKSVTAFEQQRAANEKEEQRLESLKEKSRAAAEKTEQSSKCQVLDAVSQQAPNLVKNLGGVLGVSVLSNVGSSDFLNKIGKGIL